MPNFDGTGPLKRGRVIGRRLGKCGNEGTQCPVRRDRAEETAHKE